MSDEGESLAGREPEGVFRWPEHAEVAAKRVLLTEQTQLLGAELRWLADPDRIPLHAVQPAQSDDPNERCFCLATWFLGQVVRAADRVQGQLRWEETFEFYKLSEEIRERVLRSVLEPTSRHAPGIFAMCEIVAAVPEVAIREAVPRSEWGSIARKTELFARRISYDGTDLQMLMRNYLRKAPEATKNPYQRVLSPTLLRLDDETGLTSTTPIAELIAAAKIAVAKHIRPPKGVCVALLAKAPACPPPHPNPENMFGALWSAYTHAANRFIFPHVELKQADIPPPTKPDAFFAATFDALARHRAAEWKDGYPGKIWRAAKDEIGAVLARQQQSPSPQS